MILSQSVVQYRREYGKSCFSIDLVQVPSVMFVNSQLVCLSTVGIFMIYLVYLFLSVRTTNNNRTFERVIIILKIHNKRFSVNFWKNLCWTAYSVVYYAITLLASLMMFLFDYFVFVFRSGKTVSEQANGTSFPFSFVRDCLYERSVLNSKFFVSFECVPSY